jgi:hypothetical protein
MEELDPVRASDEKDKDETEAGASDLARRLAQYRRRVEAEGRPRSVKLIDRAIEDADKKSKRRS